MQRRVGEFSVSAVRFEDAASGTDPMRIVKARPADSVSTNLLSHLRLFDSMPVFVLSPISGATQALGLDLVGVRVLVEFAPDLAVAASRMRFHEQEFA